MSEAILVEGLTKAYNGKTVVDHLNLSVKSGTVFGLLGANGAGKSTTIECILGTKQADGGTVRLLGQDPKKNRRALFQCVGVQFQEGDYQKEIRVSELCEETVKNSQPFPADAGHYHDEERVPWHQRRKCTAASLRDAWPDRAVRRTVHPLFPLGIIGNKPET